MAETKKLQVLIDSAGHIVAAHFEQEHATSSKEDKPSAGFSPLEGQRVISIDAPREVFNLPGPDLHRFLAQVKIAWPADVRIPEFKVIRKHKE